MVSNVPTSKRGQYQLISPLYLGWVYFVNVVVGKIKKVVIRQEGGNNKGRRTSFFLLLLAAKVFEGSLQK